MRLEHREAAEKFYRDLAAQEVKWLGKVPAVGVCTLCNRQFKVPLTTIKRVAEAQESLRLQFTEHECKSEMAPDTAPSGN